MKAFVSYPSEKLNIAREVYQLLRSIGVDAWLDKENLIPGDDWARAIKLALQSADLVVLICSKEVVFKAGVIQREIKQALDILRDKPRGHIFLVPLRAEDIQLPTELAVLQYCDYFRAGWQFELVRSVKHRIEQLSEAAPAPLLEYLDAQERAGGVELRTLKRGFAGFEADADYFMYRTGGEYWDYVTAEIVSDIVGGYYEASAFAVDQGLMMQAAKFDPPMAMSWSRNLREYFREGELVSLQCSAWQFFGGAHGTRGIYTKNYGGPTMGRMQLRRLFNYEASAVVRTCCTQAIAQTEERGGEVAEDLNRRWGEAVDAWSPFSQWLFNREGIRIWFSNYSDLPYVFGVFDASVPWSRLKEHLREESRDTAFGRFVTSC